MSEKGIIEFHGSLLRADQVVYAEQVGDDVGVTMAAFDEEIVFKDCRIEDFYSEWRRSITY